MALLSKLKMWWRNRCNVTTSSNSATRRDAKAKAKAELDALRAYCAKMRVAQEALAAEMKARGPSWSNRQNATAPPYTLDALVQKYPVLKDKVCSYEHNDWRHTEVFRCEGAFLAPPDLGQLTPYYIQSEWDWAKQYDERTFDAVMPDGSLVERFVKADETVGKAIVRLGVQPVLILHRTYEGRANTLDPEDGYTDSYRTWVWCMHTEAPR